MTITNHPLHRSGRALLTHPAPALGDDAKSPERIRVMQPGRWQPSVGQRNHLLPGQTTRLAATPQRPVPIAHHLKTKRRQRALIRRHPEVPVVTFNQRPKPLTDFGHSMMHSFTQFAMRPQRAGWDERRISRFSRRLLPCMPGASDLAGYQCFSPKRNIGRSLPLSPTGSASRTRGISRLNTQPALSPVNASTAFLRAPPHDSGPSRLARPLTFETFIQHNPPVYPGAQEKPV